MVKAVQLTEDTAHPQTAKSKKKEGELLTVGCWWGKPIWAWL